MDKEVCPWCESVFITEGEMCVDCAKFIADYKDFKSRVTQGYLQVVDPWEEVTDE